MLDVLDTSSTLVTLVSLQLPLRMALVSQCTPVTLHFGANYHGPIKSSFGPQVVNAHQ